jgi:Subtilase family
MQKRDFLFPEFLKKISGILLFAGLMLCLATCNKYFSYTNNYNSYYIMPQTPPDSNKWVNWNVLFQSGADNGARLQEIQILEQYLTDYITQYNALNNTHFAVNTFFVKCPCDTTLINFNAIPVAGSGQAPVPPRPPGKGVGGSGDAIQYINPNNSFSTDSTTEEKVDTTYIQTAYNSIDPSKILAVMDTGLDSSYFQNNFRPLLWSDPTGLTYRNFQFFNNGRSYDYYFDDDKYKHGTAVTALALQALERIENQVSVKPKVMILKVLDANANGNTFTVSCALSYAVKNHATLVNASLGYYAKNGEVDSVLRHYVDLCFRTTPASIPIIAAAGNIPGPHTAPLCGTTPPGNELAGTRLFYPACFSDSFPNVISVTGLQDSRQSCFYQNYSNVFVTVGVLGVSSSTADCCKFLPPFLQTGYEGSSFATPIVTGGMLGYWIANPATGIANSLDHISTNQSSGTTVTVKGKYLTYKTQ